MLYPLSYEGDSYCFRWSELQEVAGRTVKRGLTICLALARRPVPEAEAVLMVPTTATKRFSPVELDERLPPQ